MPLTIKKQTITGSLSVLSIAAPVAIPKQLLTASVAMDTALQASFSIPMQGIFGLRPEISAVIGIPAQQVQAEMFQPVLGIPMQQVSAEVAVQLEVQGTVDIPMQQWPKYVFGSIHGSLPVVQCAISGYVGYSITTSLPGVQSALAVINGAAITAHGVLPGLQAAIAVERPAEIAARLPQVRSAMVCVAGPAASLDAKLPTVGAKLHVLAGPAIRIAGTIPGVSASIAGSAVAVGTVRGALAAPRAAISATTGTVASIHAAVPLGLRSSMLLWAQPQIDLNAALPAIRARLNLRALEQAAEVINFNLRRAAVSMHESAFAPHCVAEVDGVVYAAGPGGIYAYTGTQDGTADFAQRVTFANLDYGTSRLKFLDSCLVEADATAAPKVCAKVPHEPEYQYLARGPKLGTLYRAALGRGLRHRRVQFSVEGRGVRSLSSVEVLLHESRRGF
jgi:hypothetical protein